MAAAMAVHGVVMVSYSDAEIWLFGVVMVALLTKVEKHERDNDWVAYSQVYNQNFIEMIEKNEDVRKAEQLKYRDIMTRHFDGKVCERIYNFFDNVEQ